MNPEQDLLSTAALTSFRLNGQFLALAEELARPVGLTAAWWQVLGAVLRESRSVSAIAREMGLTRQSVQRIADVLVDRGLAEYRDNPAHARAKLVQVTPAGLDAVRRIDPAHRVAAERLVADLGRDRASEIVEALTDLAEAMDRVGDTAPAR
ncbi:MarR family winged helix-turn-helix transcriptional regulator [Nocardioides sp. GXZ039]|uniref:MarR family winged helix-turn-helix transcriptional regulator n=1 Tax=Nocardioides sp. GXZ039 TaxID=3136018 RepID=UPI0030F4425B